MTIGTPHDVSGQTAKPFSRTSLRELSYNEERLEAMIAANPRLLGEDVLGRASDWVAFRQCQLQRPGKSAIRPDVLLLGSDGSLVIVEAKLDDNPELENRQVIAQAIEYTACLRRLDAKGLAEVLLSGKATGRSIAGPSLEHVLRSAFPTASDVPSLADDLMDNLSSATVEIIMACDGVPIGLREVVEDVTKVAAGAFSLRVLELRVYRQDKQLVCIPVERLRTQVVQRIQVEVAEGLGVEVRATPLDAVDVERANSAEKRQWDWPSLTERLQAAGGNDAVRGADVVKTWFEKNAKGVFFMHNVGGSFIPVFVEGNGGPLPFSVQADRPKLTAQLRISSFPLFSDGNFLHGLEQHLNRIPGVQVTADQLQHGMPSIPLAKLANKDGQAAAEATFAWILAQVKDWKPTKKKGGAP